MSAAVLGSLIAGITSFLVAGTTAYFAWRTRHSELNAPDKISAGFTELVSDLRKEIDRLEKRQLASDIRIEKLEARARQDEETISGLQSQIKWLLSRLRREDKAEFEALFHPTDPT